MLNFFHKQPATNIESQKRKPVGQRPKNPNSIENNRFKTQEDSSINVPPLPTSSIGFPKPSFGLFHSIKDQASKPFIHDSQDDVFTNPSIIDSHKPTPITPSNINADRLVPLEQDQIPESKKVPFTAFAKIGASIHEKEGNLPFLDSKGDSNKNILEDLWREDTSKMKERSYDNHKFHIY